MDSLYILPFDHRSTFIKELLHFNPPLSKEQSLIVGEYKGLVFEGFKKVYEEYEPKVNLGILCDEEFGSSILEEAKERGMVFAVCTEKSGQEIYQFEYENDFDEHLLKWQPTFAKALVRYNPKNQEMNKVQLERLKKLNDFCKKHSIKLMIEPLIVPLAAERYKKEDFDRKIRPDLTLGMIDEFYNMGVFPDVWKIEAFESELDWKQVINAALVKGKRKDVKLIVLGRGEGWDTVTRWLKLAAKFSDIIGFAVGRTVFWEPLNAYRDKKMDKNQAISEIARRYRSLIELWEKYRANF